MKDKTKGEPSTFERFEDFTRRLLKVPKKEIDAKLAEERAARAKRRQRAKKARAR